MTPFNSTFFVYMSVFECFVSLYKYMFMSPFILSFFHFLSPRQQQSVLHCRHCRTSCKQFWGKTLHNNKFSCVYFSPGCFFLSFCRNVSTAHIFSHLKHEILIFLCMCECDCVRKCIQTQTQEEY